MLIFIFDGWRGLGETEGTARAGRGLRRLNTHDTSHTGNDLGENRGCHGFSVRSRMAVDTKSINEGLASSDVTTSSAKRLGESSHQNVDFPRVDAKVICNTATVRSHCANRVSLIYEEIELKRM